MSAGRLKGAIHGVQRLAAFDTGAWASFDKTPSGFWASFMVAALLAPLNFVHVFLAASSGPKLGFVPYVVVESLAYVLQWTVFPFAMLYVARLLQRPGHYFNYLVPYNWMQLPLGLFFFLLQLAADFNVISTQGFGVLQLIGTAVFFIYGTFVAGVGLQVGVGTGLSLAVLDFVLTEILREIILKIEA